MKNKPIPPPTGIVKKKIQPPLPSKIFNTSAINQQTISIDEPQTQRPQKMINNNPTEPQKQEEIPIEVQKSEEVPITENLNDLKIDQPPQEQRNQIIVNSFVAPIPRKVPIPVRHSVIQPRKQPAPQPINKKLQQKHLFKQQNDVKVVQQTAKKEQISEAKTQKQQIPLQQNLKNEPLPQTIIEKIDQPQQIKLVTQPILNNQTNQLESTPIAPVEIIKTLDILPKIIHKVPVPMKKTVIHPRAVIKPMPKSKINAAYKKQIQQKLPQEQPAKIQKIENQTSQAIIQIQNPIEAVKDQPIIQKIPIQVPKPSSPKNVKPQIILPKPTENIDQISKNVPLPPSGPKSKMSQKLQQLRRAKQQMLVDQSFCQEGQEEELGSEQEKLNQNQIQYSKPDFVKEQITQKIQEIKQQPQKIPPIVTTTQTPVSNIQTEKFQPPKPINKNLPVLPNKSLIKQPPAPSIKKIGVPPPFQKPTKSEQIQAPPQIIKAEKLQEISPPPQFQRVTRIEQKPKQQVEVQKIEEIKPQPPKALQVKHKQPEAIPIVEKKPDEVKVKVKLQEPKPNMEINKLLQRYNSLKNGYLTNLRQLDELIHFQKQQQQTQIQKINHLLTQLHHKNQSIKQICSVQPLQESYQNTQIAI